jgi:peptide/nickel transport system permease protein
MLTYIARRILYSIPVLLGASFLIFVCVSALGDPLYVLKQNPLTSQVTLAHIAAVKHLNDPIPLRYVYWLKDVFAHGFGTPLLVNHPIYEDLLRVMPHTLTLVLAADFLALVLGCSIGIYSAVRQYSKFDYAATTLSFLGFAMPVFWLGLMLQIAFTNLFLHTGVRVFYTSGLSAPDHGGGLSFILDRVQHMAIPVIVVSVVGIATYSRFMRAAMLDVINSDYVRTARAKGLNEMRVIAKHVLRNAAIPIVTIWALTLGGLIGGAVVTETIFQLDGMGPYFLQALGQQDVYPVMAWLMVTSVVIIAFNLIADILYGLLDPRIRLA